MKPIKFKNTYFIKASPGKVYDILTDFSGMPKNFPSVARSIDGLKRDGNAFSFDLYLGAPDCRKPVLMRMNGVIKPGEGFSSTNTFPLGVEHETFTLTSSHGGTTLLYMNSMELKNFFLHTFGSFFAKRSVLKNLNAMMRDLQKIFGVIS